MKYRSCHLYVHFYDSSDNIQYPQSIIQISLINWENKVKEGDGRLYKLSISYPLAIITD
jgi:hypothetical protein